jgi:uncharacterized protein
MSDAARPIFHYAFTVFDIAATRAFYGALLGCREGRRSGDTVSCDFDFFGHHLVTHLVTGEDAERQRQAMEGKLAKRHFGLVLPREQWDRLAETLTAAGAEFYVKPKIRNPGEANEEALMIVLDPSGNGIEFKSVRHADTLFAARRDA